MYFLFIYENRRMTPVEITLRKVEKGQEREKWKRKI
jgi:isocitrate dehydrogenase kinase/phosphatase